MKEQDEKKPKLDQSVSADLRGKQPVKQAKDNSSHSDEAPKENFIHVRARRGQATNSHSLAERVSYYYTCLLLETHFRLS